MKAHFVSYWSFFSNHIVIRSCYLILTNSHPEVQFNAPSKNLTFSKLHTQGNISRHGILAFRHPLIPITLSPPCYYQLDLMNSWLGIHTTFYSYINRIISTICVCEKMVVDFYIKATQRKLFSHFVSTSISLWSPPKVYSLRMPLGLSQLVKWLPSIDRMVAVDW